MPTYSGEAHSQPGPVVDTSVEEPSQGFSFMDSYGPFTSSPLTLALPNAPENKWKNAGNVYQRLTLVATNLSSNVNSVDVNVGGGSNVIELAPNQEVQPTFTIDVDIPATPTENGAPAVVEAFSFDVEATWEVM